MLFEWKNLPVAQIPSKNNWEEFQIYKFTTQKGFPYTQKHHIYCTTRELKGGHIEIIDNFYLSLRDTSTTFCTVTTSNDIFTYTRAPLFRESIPT